MKYNGYTLFLILLLELSNIVHCNIHIISPKELAQKFTNGIIIGSLGKFGSIPYGVNIDGVLSYYPQSLENNKSFNACEWPEDYSFNSNDIYSIPIVMADRGDCSFVKKVLNIESKGGHVAIVVDSTDEDVTNIVMAEDGHGSLVTIPSLLISKKDGNILKKFMKENKDKPINLEIDFEIEKGSNSELNLYMSSNQEEVYTIMKSFKEYFYLLNSEEGITLTPHYITNKDPLYSLDSLTKKEKEDIFKECYGEGKYCVTGFINNSVSIDVNSSLIIEENLIQKCIYLEGKSSKNSSIWYDYMLLFYDNCYNSNNFTKEWGQDVMDNLNVNKGNILKCVESSFIYPSNITDESKKDNRKKVENTILNKDNDLRATYYVKYIPSLLINGKVFYGNWTKENLFEAICSSIVNKPESCLSNGIQNLQVKSSSNHKRLLIVVVLCLLISIIIFAYCRYKFKKNISENLESSNIGHKISTVVTSYMSLKDTAK